MAHDLETQDGRLDWLIDYLHRENPAFPSDGVEGYYERRHILRCLVNVRPPKPVSEEFLKIQDAFLKDESAMQFPTGLSEMISSEDGLYLWQGDITTLTVDAIVNAANEAMLGCFSPGHNCIDNIIHTKAGVQLRFECAQIMADQGHPEPAGQCKVTKAYNLPCKYVLHTVGPIVGDKVTDEDRRLLASCYRSCLEACVEHGIESVAFCGVSTGVFRFPKEEAAKIAVATVRQCLAELEKSGKKAPRVVFDTYTDEDFEYYHRILFNHE